MKLHMAKATIPTEQDQMADKGWKKAERRMARDVGSQRIAVTGERHGADFEDGIAVYQLKVRNAIPGWLWDWLTGIQGCGKRTGKAGVLVLKHPRQRDTEAVVVLSWSDWVSLHGCPRPEAGSEEARS